MPPSVQVHQLIAFPFLFSQCFFKRCDCLLWWELSVGSMDGTRYTGPRYIGARRGVFGLQSWAPVRKPVEPETLPVLNHSDRQTMNAPSFPALQQQQLPRAAQSTLLPDTHAEQVANSFGENPNAVKPCELFFACFHLKLIHIYNVQILAMLHYASYL